MQPTLESTDGKMLIFPNDDCYRIDVSSRDKGGWLSYVWKQFRQFSTRCKCFMPMVARLKHSSCKQLSFPCKPEQPLNHGERDSKRQNFALAAIPFEDDIRRANTALYTSA